MNLPLTMLPKEEKMPTFATPHPSLALARRLGFETIRKLILFVLMFAMSMVSFYFFHNYVVTTVIVRGTSMSPTLKDGHRYFLNRLAFCFRPPQRGDLVVLRDPGHEDLAVKRIVGLPCESILLKRGDVYVNGSHLQEPYLAPNTPTFSTDAWEKFVMVGKDSFFVMGDNRMNSEDSRDYGPITRENILGLISQ